MLPVCLYSFACLCVFRVKLIEASLSRDAAGSRTRRRVASSPAPRVALFAQRTPIYHGEGQLRILYLIRSVPRPNSAFLWKTAVILIDEIQRCPKQSGRSPTVAHRRGAPVLPLLLAKKGARPENTRGKSHDFSSKGARKAAILYRQWESAAKPFSTCRRKQYLLGVFLWTHSGPNNE